MLIGIIVVIIFLSILILAHEFGHFLVAKKFGLWVEEFGFGLPPRIWGKKIGETIYSINALPFGGFVKIYGEDREEAKIIPEEISLEVEIKEEIAIDENKIEMAAEESIIERNTDLANRNFSSLPVIKRAAIIVAGVSMNFLLGWLMISIVFNIGIPQAILITDVAQNSPAAEVDLRTSDKIIGFSSVGVFIKYIDEYRGEKVVLKIERAGKKMEIRATPRLNPPVGEGALGIVLAEVGLPKQNFFASVWEGLKTSLEIIKIVFITIFNLIKSAFVGRASLEAVTGPVGIVKITAQAGSLGFVYLLQLLALISLNLAVINIFPFPALDGGRLLFLLIEKIKGSPLPAKFERYANAVGFALLLFLMAVITIKDIVRFF